MSLKEKIKEGVAKWSRVRRGTGSYCDCPSCLEFDRDPADAEIRLSCTTPYSLRGVVFAPQQYVYLKAAEGKGYGMKVINHPDTWAELKALKDKLTVKATLAEITGDSNEPHQ